MPERILDAPQMPNVCLSCGDRGHLTPRKVSFAYTSRQNQLLSFLADLLGFIYVNETVYTLQAPLCSDCGKHSRRSKILIVAMWPALVALVIIMFSMSDDIVPISVVPALFLVACSVYYLVLRSRGVPKTVLVDGDNLIIDVPGYGELTLYERLPSPHRRTQPQPQKMAQAPPRLNRAVCSQCDFINFASAVECKKCFAPAGATATV
ncbi:MAG: hypothetical protein H7Z38_16765 [Rubrivivax sp.]|nr:hypothetical protein [Pyrinomonadaceae bacterium]